MCAIISLPSIYIAIGNTHYNAWSLLPRILPQYIGMYRNKHVVRTLRTPMSSYLHRRRYDIIIFDVQYISLQRLQFCFWWSTKNDELPLHPGLFYSGISNTSLRLYRYSLNFAISLVCILLIDTLPPSFCVVSISINTIPIDGTIMQQLARIQQSAHMKMLEKIQQS